MRSKKSNEIKIKEPSATVAVRCPNCEKRFGFVVFDNAVIFTKDKSEKTPRRTRFYVR